ncbi:nucleotidyltransferase family protein [Amycolatopsis mongoliensis]|uniref:Nucleotidyltransferase family protein n=1 Tax=Amycolatopsis mongoliensis TaxID=715475 RepID=A0A9Y2K0U4_9PSEU|nr:nucleotidyltransferase family protein [Amycolatopsis sp. 4-36]WIY06837.1 nucleotidyltransferase family protein [Amycolatopsis sp. 4-36]
MADFERLQDILSHNEILVELLHRAREFDLPHWYFAAGCVVQTVWNVLSERGAARGIQDYDLVYHDAADLGWDAEDRVIRTVAARCEDLPAEVEVRNEARVHLWYEAKFGLPCRPYPTTESAIDAFPSVCSCIGVRLERDGTWHFHAPRGLDDLFAMVVRPNPVLAPREVYETKAARWLTQWPRLRVLPWP